MVYFGKPDQCYRCHIEAVYSSWKRLYNQRHDVIANLCRHYKLPPERFKISSLFTVAFHDAGKTSLWFQQRIFKIAKGKGLGNPQMLCSTCNAPITWPSLERKMEPYRHEIISGVASLYFCRQLDRLFETLGVTNVPFEFFAIIGHHKPVNPDTFRREWNRFWGDPDELSAIGYGSEQWGHVMEVAQSIFEREGFSLPYVQWKDIYQAGDSIIEKVKESIDTIPIMVQDAVDENGSTQVIGQIRETLALLKNLLIAADWEGSIRANSPETCIHSAITISANDFWENVKRDIELNSGKPFKPRHFQKDLTDLLGHGIAVAPTGSGKTEGALGWALTNKSENGKILYVLPNQVLTNSIYERLVKYFGKENIGLLHSGSLLYQILSRTENDESEQCNFEDFAPTSDERYLHTLSRMMFRPIMVATVDQLLMTAFNGNKRWSVVMGEVMGGTIIFDEVHAYDGHMLALLERITREIREYSKILFMSATMPGNLINFLSRLLGATEPSHVIKDEELLQKARNKYETVAQPLLKEGKLGKAIVDRIEKLNKEGKRVAIVCNTVDSTQNIYKQLKDKFGSGKENKDASDDNIMCLHSRFIAKHRRGKEKVLEKDKTKSRSEQSWPQVLVATQVIECGMDIDYDVLFTEGAPLEAIIQRAGRINRERNPYNKGMVYVYAQDESSKKFYPPEITSRGLEILRTKTSSTAAITEDELIKMIEEVYEGKIFEKDLRFLNTRRMLDELIYDIGAVQDLPETDLHTRFITYKMVEVVPEELWNDIRGENQFVIMEHLVKMPLWVYQYLKVREINENWKVMTMQYDEEIGGFFKENLNQKFKSELLFA